MYHQFISVLTVKKININIHIMNTFFALSIASYYVGMQFVPKKFQWPLHIRLYEIQVELCEENFQPIFISSDFSPTAHYAVLNRGNTHVFSDKIRGHTLPAGQNNTFINNTLEASSLSPSGIVLQKHGAMGSPHSPQTPHLPPATNASEALQILEENQNVAQQRELLPLNHHGVVDPVGLNALRISHPVIDIVERLVERGAEAETASPATPQEFLLPWGEYMGQCDKKYWNFLLTNWLSKLAPKAGVSAEDMPFHRALIETLISDQFLGHINARWLRDESESMKALHCSFFEAYLKAIDWSKTRYKKLFLVEGSVDLHQMDEDAYLHAYNVPSKLGLSIWKDADFPVH